jgi:hypothetical protein
MRAKAKCFDFLANGAHLFFGGLRLHDDEHVFTLKSVLYGDGRLACPVERSPTFSPRLQEKPHSKSTVARSCTANEAVRPAFHRCCDIQHFRL